MKKEIESLTYEQLQQQYTNLEQQHTNLEQQHTNLEQQHTNLEQQHREVIAKLRWYEEQFRLAQQKRFGASSEKTDPGQLEFDLFNEAEVLATPEDQQLEMEKVAYERRKTSGKREEDLSRLSVETVTYSLAEGEKTCHDCGGSFHEMSTETRCEIAVVPPEVKVVRTVFSASRKFCNLTETVIAQKTPMYVTYTLAVTVSVMDCRLRS